MNRVLTWDEVRELRAGERVWVEHADCRFRDEVHDIEIDGEDECVVLRASFDGTHYPRWYAMPECEWDYNRVWRAWDAEPTQEERGNAPEWGTEVI